MCFICLPKQASVSRRPDSNEQRQQYKRAVQKNSTKSSTKKQYTHLTGGEPLLVLGHPHGGGSRGGHSPQWVVGLQHVVDRLAHKL